jgi:hypothetical protein
MRRKNITTEDTNLSKKALALARAFKGSGAEDSNLYRLIQRKFTLTFQSVQSGLHTHI